jgi:hypothetical protein
VSDAAARSVWAGHVVMAAAACGEPAAVHGCDGGLRAHLDGSARLQRLVFELAPCVIAALEQLAGDRRAGAVAGEPRGGLLVVGVVGAARASGELRRLMERPAQRGRALAGEGCPGARRWSDWWTVMSRPA